MQANKSLTDKLEHYSTTSRGQGVRGKSAAEWAGYAAAAGASLAMAGAADASIIYSGVQNVTAQIDPSVQAPAGVFQAISSATFNVGGSVFIAIAGEQAGRNSANSAKYMGGGFIQVSTPKFLNDGVFLAASQLIGAGGGFSGTRAGQLRVIQNSAGGGSPVVATSYVNPFVQAPFGVTGIVGVKLASGNYGWIRLKVEDLGLNQPLGTLFGGNPIGNGQGFGDKITVIDWAYENSGAAIHVGATGSPVGVPEPSALALLAAGAAGIGAFRRRKAERTVH